MVYVVRRGHHTGLALAVADWPNRNGSVLANFPQARYLEFGWGDAAYYQAPDPTLGVTIAAVFWPTPVMEVVPRRQVVAQGVEDSETVALHVTDAELQAIAKSTTRSCSRSARLATATTLPAAARFSITRGKFHMFRMCNRWTAERLQVAGCSVRPALIMTASQAITAANVVRERCRSGFSPTLHAVAGAAANAPSRVRICFCSNTKLTTVCSTPVPTDKNHT